MKRPAILTRVFGHPVVMLTAYGLLAWMAYQWWTGATTAAAATVALCLAMACTRANDRAEKYHQWQREWNAMSGQPPRGRISPRALRQLGAVLAFGFLGMLSLTYLNDPAVGWAAWLFWIAMAVGLVRLLWRRTRVRRAERASKNSYVATCLHMPAQSPSYTAAYAALPDYCRQVLGH